jgi:hypothetical protein
MMKLMQLDFMRLRRYIEYTFATVIGMLGTFLMLPSVSTRMNLRAATLGGYGPSVVALIPNTESDGSQLAVGSISYWTVRVTAALHRTLTAADAKNYGYDSVSKWAMAAPNQLPWWSCVDSSTMGVDSGLTETASGVPLRFLVQGWGLQGQSHLKAPSLSYEVDDGLPFIKHLTHYEAKSIILVIPLLLNITFWSLIALALLRTRRIYAWAIMHLRRRAGLCPQCGHIPMRSDDKAWCPECGWNR